jgi:hypothetical protein
LILLSRLLLAVAIASTTVGQVAGANELLDGRVFAGMIGPAENPDLEDSLHFNDGYFWSDICTRCGFVPGRYRARETEEGIEFSGVLVSDSRGRFSYNGLVTPDGAIRVDIDWEKERWYWTARRRIVFTGLASGTTEPVPIGSIRTRIESFEPDGNPACARF